MTLYSFQTQSKFQTSLPILMVFSNILFRESSDQKRCPVSYNLSLSPNFREFGIKFCAVNMICTFSSYALCSFTFLFDKKSHEFFFQVFVAGYSNLQVSFLWSECVFMNFFDQCRRTSCFSLITNIKFKRFVLVYLLQLVK